MSRSLQQGATLIIVLFIVLLVTIIATVAIRQSSVSLNIATSSQAQKLMMQNSDAALLRFEKLHQQNNSTAVNSLFSIIKKNKGSEVVWCYSDLQKDFFNINNFGLIYWTSGNSKPTTVSTSSFCTNKTFSTGRSNVVTQVSATVSANQSSVISDSSNDNSIQPLKITVYTTSFIPALSSVDGVAINECLTGRMSSLPPFVSEGETVSRCLTRLNVPNYTAVAEYQDAN